MSLLKLFKLEKLRIEAYKDENRKMPVSPTSMEVMFNPTSYKKTHAITFSPEALQAIGSPGKPAAYAFTPPGEISFQFIFDGTGVSDFGAVHMANLLHGKSVKKDIEKFEKICLKMNGDIHAPNFLKIFWGNHLNFSCRLRSFDINYKLFDKGGDPLRAELDVTFIDDRSAEALALEADKKSPDLTHVRTVKSGDTLPLLCKEIYGSSAYYFRVAAENDLDDFRSLVPGQKLNFPPLQSGEENG